MRGGVSGFLRLGLRIVLAGAWLWAGLAKVRGPHRFAADITGFQLLTAPAPVLALAYYLPWVEILCAVGLWTPRWRAGALAVGTALLGVFTLALISAWTRGLHLDCGCFGPGAPGGVGTNFPLAVLRNLALLGAGGFLWRAEEVNGVGTPGKA